MRLVAVFVLCDYSYLADDCFVECFEVFGWDPEFRVLFCAYLLWRIFFYDVRAYFEGCYVAD